jgi:hypothetical protein
VVGDRHHRALDETLDILATAEEQPAQAAGDRGQHHVVDLGLLDVGDSFGGVEATPDNGQQSLGAHGLVEAGPWGRLVGQYLSPRRQRASRQAQRPLRMDQA